MRFYALLATLLPLVSALPASTTEADPQKATGTPGRIPEGNPAPKPNPYERTGNLTEPLVKPYMPAGGINTNRTDIPVYEPLSDFDYQSLALALYQEYIELDLFNYGLRKFSDEEFEEAGINATDRGLIQIMANQEIGHSTMLRNILGEHAPEMCEYEYHFDTVREFIDFCQAVTRWGEAGVYGFLPHLDSRASAQLLLQSITTEARQQMAFRQLEGLPATVEWHQIGFPQSYAWTLLAPNIKGCPVNNTHLVWQNFPALNIKNQPKAFNESTVAALNTNLTEPLSWPGREVVFEWEEPGKKVGPNGSYVTNTTAGSPKWAAWISQLNVTYTPLYDIENNTAKAVQPAGYLYDELNPLVNGTVFVSLTDMDVYLTPHNMTIINDHTVAGPAVYYAS